MAEEKYLKQYEKSASGNYLLKSRGILEFSKTVTAATTLTQEESGSTIFMVAGADNVVITLPAVKAGLSFKFVHSAASAAATCRITPVGASIVGYVVAQEGGNADATTADGLVSVLDGADDKYVQLTKATGHKGNYIELCCDGADWFVVGGVGTFAHQA
tara:strand:+ start:76 stop:552 length:477 start_codon:yes stop_codon:yes gene_type:complete